MIDKLKLLSDVESVSLGTSRDKRYVYLLSSMHKMNGNIIKPTPLGSCAMVISMAVDSLYKADEELKLLFNQYSDNSKQLIEILNHCETENVDLPVLGYIKGIMWIGLEEDIVYLGGRKFKEWSYEQT